MIYIVFYIASTITAKFKTHPSHSCLNLDWCMSVFVLVNYYFI